MKISCLYFFKQKTAYELRISDWSSDVCSSDLDAVAGVVNTILRKDYDGAEAKIRHGGADDGSMDETSATFLGGKNFNDGRTNVMGFVGYYHRDALEASSKDFTDRKSTRLNSSH